MNTIHQSSQKNPDLKGRFGSFGGRFVPETLMHALDELESAFLAYKDQEDFENELTHLLNNYVGRPTPLYYAENLTKELNGAQIYLKREDLSHTGAHKINNALGQGLLAKRMGKRRIIAETGAGQHGVATATIASMLNQECVIYMGSEDIERQSLNVFRMKILGATVVSVESGSRTLKDAINEAMRDWVTNVESTHYLIGSAIGPHPFPTIVRDFQSVIGIEAREQMITQAGKLPEVAIACVGGGSNAIGLFSPLLEDPIRLIGVEAGGRSEQTGEHSATLSRGKPGILHGTKTYLLQDKNGQIEKTHSISAGLDYPGVGPEHSWLKDTTRAEYLSVNDQEALEGFQLLTRTEGIIPALEPSHAIYAAAQIASEMKEDEDLLIGLSGRGDKDMHTVATAFGITL